MGANFYGYLNNALIKFHEMFYKLGGSIIQSVKSDFIKLRRVIADLTISTYKNKLRNWNKPLFGLCEN